MSIIVIYHIVSLWNIETESFFNRGSNNRIRAIHVASSGEVGFELTNLGVLGLFRVLEVRVL